MSKSPELSSTDQERQILTPDQIEKGMTIGVVCIIPGKRPTERALRAAAVLTGLLKKEPGENRLAAVSQAWHGNDIPHGVSPLWNGEVQWKNDEGVMVALTGTASEAEPFSYLGHNSEDLPAPSISHIQYNSFEQLGITTPPHNRKHKSSDWQHKTLLLSQTDYA